eukprot:CAMPEP_0172728312 /NCGR_PEP_ID=MMETSP1074-20121228/92170_1 /TAXON_ID=2916 /ORGANISM="Ceratium fusus, Strain PA161109" /LENGTH=589 /DNA_ID=CAMNT_0013555545 /DNA_START=127 /DNA_END=1898 /DNA_ORIENTATION=+
MAAAAAAAATGAPPNGIVAVQCLFVPLWLSVWLFPGVAFEALCSTFSFPQAPNSTETGANAAAADISKATGGVAVWDHALQGHMLHAASPNVNLDDVLPTAESDFTDDDPLPTAAASAAAFAEPEPDASSSGVLSVTTRVEYSALVSGMSQDVYGLVTVQAGTGPLQAERQPMDLVVVLDVSGSMMGDRISQVKDATRFILDQACRGDRISIVSFNSCARRDLRLRIMDAVGKDEANRITTLLSAGGGTSIAAGMDMALSIMEQRRHKNKVSAILVLTDGQDSWTASQLPKLMQRAAAASCPVYAFGFGSDHDAVLLSAIAEQAKTPFTFVEDTSKIREAFAGAVGGLSSIVAQRVQLSLTSQSQVTLKVVHTAFPSQQRGGETTIMIPDMFASERRDVLVELSVPAAVQGQQQISLLLASARYVDLQQNCLVQTPPVVMEAMQLEEPQPEIEPDEEVTAQRERVEVTRALNDAAAASDRGQFDVALQVIEDCDGRMKKAKKQTAANRSLTLELVEARESMRNREAWESGGRAELRDAAQMHSIQRTTSVLEGAGGSRRASRSMYLSETQDDGSEGHKAMQASGCSQAT